MDIHAKTKGIARDYHMPRTAYTIQRGTVNFDGISIDGVLQLKASKLLNGKVEPSPLFKRGDSVER